jgi:hypothetical protein
MVEQSDQRAFPGDPVPRHGDPLDEQGRFSSSLEIELARRRRVGHYWLRVGWILAVLLMLFGALAW